MIVGVAGGKGGVGKTTVALNLGMELDAVVVDADLSMADLPDGRGPDLHDVLAGRADPIEAVQTVGPVELLPCGRSLAGARAGDPRAVVSAVRSVVAKYGVVVVDCPAGLSADAGLPLYVADQYVLVTTPDSSAIADAVRTRALARELDAGLRRVVLNRVRGEPSTERIRESLGAPVVVVPESDAVARANDRGRPVKTVDPASRVADVFGRLAAVVHFCKRV